MMILINLHRRKIFFLVSAKKIFSYYCLQISSDDGDEGEEENQTILFLFTQIIENLHNKDKSNP